MTLLRPLKSRRWSRFEIRIPTTEAPDFERTFEQVRARFDPALSDAEVARRVWLAGVAALLGGATTTERKEKP